MNPDYTSDLKLVQRYILSNSLYLLTMFEKKIDTFTGNSCSLSKSAKSIFKKDYLFEGIYLEQNTLFMDPYKQLSKDLTKPLWNCITKVAPHIIFTKYSVMQPLQGISTFSKNFGTFINRYKNEHEDQSNFKIHLKSYDCEEEFIKLKGDGMVQNNSKFNKVVTNNINLLKVLNKSIGKERENWEDEEIERQQNELAYLKIMFHGMKEIIDMYIKKEDQSFCNELDTFNYIVTENISSILDAKIGALVICLQPKLKYFPLLLHPLFISIYTVTKNQIHDFMKKQSQKRDRNIQEKKPHEDMEEQTPFSYEDLQYQNCSKMVFINLDGYQSQYNVDMAKYLSRNVMYISFPKESFNRSQENPLQQYEQWRSERLLRKYFYGGLTKQQKQKLLRFHQLEENQFKKNMFIFPVHSKSLSEKFYLHSIEQFESHYIMFILKQILLNHILDFNPSCIIVSYSQKLYIDNEVFAEIMKELTVIANYRVIFYANISKNYLFEQFLPEEEMKEGRKLCELEKSYFDTYETKINLKQPYNNINLDIFQKIAIATKIISGTYNLSKTIEKDSYVEKYKNYKVMEYASKLLKALQSEFPNLDRLRIRVNEYSTISKVLKNYFSNKNDSFQKMFGKVLTKYHQNTLKAVEAFIMSEGKVQEDRSLQELKQEIQLKHDHLSKKESWQNLKFHYSLEVTTEKTQSKFYAHIPKYKPKMQKKFMSSKQCENLLSLQFQIAEKEKTLVEFTQATKIYYDTERKHKNALIYLINYLSKNSSTSYNSYYGIINQALEEKPQQRVQMFPVNFIGEQLNKFEAFTEFTYLQTENYIFMFWPKVFNLLKYLTLRMLNKKYTPSCTKLFFRALRQKPGQFYSVKIENSQYKTIIPRFGCKCYEVSNTNTIYVFGGFYSNQNNYLAFQTDITMISFKKQGVMIENVPKNFHFEHQVNPKRGTKNLINIKNDFVRPRIEYQILQNDKKPGQIFLIGGIGENFQRPYSLLGYMAHKIIFDTESGDLCSIERIKMNNVVPVNVQNPLKMRQSNEMNIIQTGRNRSLFLSEGQTSMSSYTIAHNEIIYNDEQQKFYYETQYNFADPQLKSYRDEVSFLKKSLPQPQQRTDISAELCYSKEYSNNMIIIKRGDKKQGFQMHLQLSVEVRAPQKLPSYIKLTGASIKSIDLNGLSLYAIINHPKYTLGQYILAFADINQFTQNKSEFILQQIYSFDRNVGHNVVMVANPLTVAILHGHKFDEEVEVPEKIIKKNKNKKNANKVFEVHPSGQLSKQLVIPSKLIHGLNCSFFLNLNNGKVLCLSFKSLERNPVGEIVYILIQRLNLANITNQYRWDRVSESEYNFIINNQGMKKNEEIKIIEVIEQKNQSSKFQILIYCKNDFHKGVLDVQGPKDIKFKSLNMSQEKYQKQWIEDPKKQHPIKLEKHPYLYEDLKNEQMID